MNKTRKIAVNRIIVDNRMINGPIVLEIQGNKVLEYFLLENEQHSTEWLGGTAYLESHNGRLLTIKDGHQL